MSPDELEAEIKRQQPPGDILPLELFCPSCGQGHLAGPVNPELGKCRKCDTRLTILRPHPDRKRR